MKKSLFSLAFEENEKYFHIANELLEKDVANFICEGALKFLNSLQIQNSDLDDSFEILLSEANEFYESYLIKSDKFQVLSSSQKSQIIFQFFKKDLPDWILEETDYDYSADTEFNSGVGDAPYDVNKIDIINDKFEVQSLYKKYKFGELELSPDYQRNFVWTSKQKSRLIESILIKIPLPIFYIDARNEDQWVIIDGLQRLTSIFTFMNSDFKLSSLEYLTELNGKKFNTLERKYQRRIEDFQILCNLIRPNTPPDIAFSIFKRINTLGSKLEIQEIRNAMFKGKSTTLLTELSKSKEFLDIVTESKVKGLSKRMDDHALILRYLSFKINGYLDYDKNDMNKFLEQTMTKINHMHDLEIESLKETFFLCMVKAKALFQQSAFSKPSKNQSRPNPISKTLFESIGYTLDKYSLEDIIKNKDALNHELNNLYIDDEFIFKTSVATNNPLNVKYRFKSMEKLFSLVIGY